MTTSHDNYAVAEFMRLHGGSFVRSLADCWSHADTMNRRRLEECFPELFEKYRNHVEAGIEPISRKEGVPC